MEKFTFQRDDANGFLIGPDGCHYETESEAMYFGVLGLCGCGRPSDVHRLLVDCAKAFSSWDGPRGVTKVAEIVREHPDVVAEFIAHFLDQKEIIEHGSSVYGGWTTDIGDQFVAIGAMTDG